VKSIFLEGMLVAILGGVLALAANALSPQGLSLRRNYFPSVLPINSALTNSANATPGSTANPVKDRLVSKGLQYAEADIVKAAFDSPATQQGQIVFVDARDDDHYAAGHIPGAWQLNYYHPEKHLADVLPACLAALQIFIYCNGGECEDSEFTALLLRNGGIPAEKLFVFGGGITEWTQRHWPVESGARQSGSIKTGP